MIVQSAKVLKNLRKISNNSDVLLTTVADAPHIAVINNLAVFYDYSDLEHEIGAIIEDLKKKGYIVEGFNSANFRLTLKGLHPYRFAWETLKAFFLKSVLVPVFVSIITTLIALWLRVQL